jgi:hypothetical protein
VRHVARRERDRERDKDKHRSAEKKDKERDKPKGDKDREKKPAADAKAGKVEGQACFCEPPRVWRGLGYVVIDEAKGNGRTFAAGVKAGKVEAQLSPRQSVTHDGGLVVCCRPAAHFCHCSQGPIPGDTFLFAVASITCNACKWGTNTICLPPADGRSKRVRSWRYEGGGC